MNKFARVVVLGLASLAVPVLAIPTPYGAGGTINGATYTFTATGDGAITAYFVGRSAYYGSAVGLSINGAEPIVWGLKNIYGPDNAFAYGKAFDMGTVKTGDILRFVLGVTTGDGAKFSLNSEASLNTDGSQHIYSYAYGGDAGGTPIPAGMYVGFEDKLLGSSDWDYNDHQFVFAGPGLSVPDGGITIMLLGIALGGLGYARRLIA